MDEWRHSVYYNMPSVTDECCSPVVYVNGYGLFSSKLKENNLPNDNFV